MTNWMKFSVGSMLSQLRRTLGSAANSAIRVPWVMGVAGLVVAGAKLIALGLLNWTVPEKVGVGTSSSTIDDPSESMSSQEELRPKAVIEG